MAKILNTVVKSEVQKGSNLKLVKIDLLNVFEGKAEIPVLKGEPYEFEAVNNISTFIDLETSIELANEERVDQICVFTAFNWIIIREDVLGNKKKPNYDWANTHIYGVSKQRRLVELSNNMENNELIDLGISYTGLKEAVENHMVICRKIEKKY
jgi:hypothetical protein